MSHDVALHRSLPPQSDLINKLYQGIMKDYVKCLEVRMVAMVTTLTSVRIPVLTSMYVCTTCPHAVQCVYVYVCLDLS